MNTIRTNLVSFKLSAPFAFVAALAFLSAAASAEAQSIIYVNQSATGNNNGGSWMDAFIDLQSALAIAQAGDQVWVAKGIYLPTSNPHDKYASFPLLQGVALLGGFSGMETSESERNAELNVTILSGDLAGDDEPGFVNYTENSEKVVSAGWVDGTAVLDGFTISAGNAPLYGGGLYIYGASPQVRNCTFSQNQAGVGGGGLYCGSPYPSPVASPSISRCTFRNNSSDLGGGAHFYDSDPVLTDCQFLMNLGGSGGGAYAVDHDGTPQGHQNYVRCSFQGNQAYLGAGIYDFITDSMLEECTFSNNDGGAVYFGYGTFSLTACTFEGNRVSETSGVAGALDVSSSSGEIRNCIFRSNQGYAGGAIRNWGNLSSSLTVTNSLFHENRASERGGAMDCGRGNVTLINCTLSGNLATTIPSTMTCQRTALVATDCILWDGGTEIVDLYQSSVSVNYSNVEGGFLGTGNINVDPQFVDPVAGNLRLKGSSPCIDAGDNSAVPLGITTDLDGNRRFVDIATAPDTGVGPAPIVDMGAYERQLPKVRLAR